MKVQKITLSNFRGSSNKTVVNFDKSKSLSLIFGENGTGKSTIIDAFDFICKKKFGSLDNFSINKSANKYIVAYGKKAAESLVELECDTGKWQAILSGGSIVTSPSDVPDANILRRPAILKLIEQPPSKRFEELKTFISVPFTEKTENSLRDAIRDTERLFDEYSRALLQANDALENLWKENGKMGKSSTEWAESQIKTDITLNKTIVDTISSFLSLFSNIENISLSLDTAQKTEASALIDLENALSKKQVFEEEQKGQDIALLTLLQEAGKYLGDNKNLDSCPVCGSAQNIDQLSRSITARIQGMKETEILSLEIKKAEAALKEKQALKSQRENDFLNGLKKLIGSVDILAEEIKAILHLKPEFVDSILLSSGFSSAIFIAYLEWHDVFYDIYKKQLEEKKDMLQKSVDLYGAIQNQLNVVNEKKEMAKIKENSLSKLTAILSIVEKERKDYIENILEDISHEVSRLYAELHPDEKIGNPRFYLKPNVKNSLEFDASFYGANQIPPQAYYSESHLDTLGICVFIALAKYYKTDSSILLLDDVLTSVDAQHMDRFMTMLHEQSKIFNQIIVTTHYRPWKDRYKFTRSAVSNIDVIELGPWSLNNGIQISEFKEALSELKEILIQKTFDRQVVASKAGIILESMLDFITLRYRCSLPRNGRNEYTLGELVGGIDSKLAKLLTIKKDGKEIALKPLLDAAIASQWIRNQVGCHFNLSGSDITDSEVRNFALSVIEIAELLICPKCMNLPKKNSGSFWICGCKDNHLELHPLTQPGVDPRIDDDI
ncbi:AAA family ATPase [Treponema sp. TIM-1]|uniref:ATP-binding protein n=1 Tax=Treponema sp. TIM-1 TaxID=2898417 RepID=UPI00397EDC10